MMEIFLNKKILFFAPQFFGYEIEIKNKLKELGTEVDYYDERMNPNNFEKFLIRFAKNTLKKKISVYYEKIIEDSKLKKYDCIFFLNPETVTKDLINKLRKNQPNAKFIIYMFDSLKNKKNVIEFIDLFDVHYTFDKNDCFLYPKFKFRPLFYLDEYRENSTYNTNNKYDLAFVGTIHSDRYEIIKKIKKELASDNLNTFFFMYFPSKMIYVLRKIFDKTYKKTKMKDFRFSPLGKKEVLNILSHSNVVLDIQHPNQTGLTMRTIEILGLKKKLITTNKDIENYDFYSEKNIYIIDRDNPIIDKKFFEEQYVDIEKKVYLNYSIESWLIEIFNF